MGYNRCVAVYISKGVLHEHGQFTPPVKKKKPNVSMLISRFSIHVFDFSV